ncbi:DNA repair protein RecN [Dermacoccaceae bacterium W4C1]
MGQHLVVVHGQADQWRLQRPDQHRLMVDTFGGVQVRQAQEKYSQVRQLWRDSARELRELQQAQRDRAQRLALLTAGLEEIERVDPKPGEDAALVTEIERLGNVEDLQRAAHAAHVELAGDEDAPASSAGSGAAEAIAQVRAQLQQVADLDASATELRTRADELGVLVTELAADVSSYLSGLEAEPERLGQANQRLSELRGLQRTYGDTTEDVLAWSAASAAEAGDLAGTDHRIEALVAQVADLGPQVAQAAIELTAARTAAAAELGRRVTEELGHLAMGSAQVEVAVTQVEAAPGAGLELPDGRRVTDHPHGVDDVEIRMAAGPGRSARNVAKAASGGELSRVMLALEVVTASGDVPTFVFDEVDAGVGGAAALDVGARLKALAAHAQVIVVTHLAQVAAYADHHLVVRKTDDGQITSSGVVAVTGAAREAELARMLGGMSESSTAREHARELLDTAAGRRG